MIPKRVTLENFLSYGPKTEIAFADDDPLWVIGGPNGVGKSAVFDAMTYCLYAEHRGGGRGHENLIRHGADGFKVAFEFEFAGTDYRITRSRRGRTPTQAVERRLGGSWERVKDVDGAEAVTAWVESTLGLKFEAFCASVLLRQGKADDILDATPTKRMETLKKIIGVERYEELSGQVNTARREREAILRRLQADRVSIPEVSQQDLDNAHTEVDRNAQERERADENRQRATAAVPLAEQWARLGRQIADLELKLAEADLRCREATTIRLNHARWAELSSVLPILQQVIPLRAQVIETERALTESATRRDILRTQAESSRQRAEGLRQRSHQQRQEASDLSAELDSVTQVRDRQRGFLTLADDVAKFRTEESAFPPTLDTDLAAIRDAQAQAADVERARAGELSEASAGLKQAQKEQKAFDTVDIGVKCSKCGQRVSADHAERERRELAERVASHTAEVARAKRAADDATAVRVAADAQLTYLAERTAKRNQIRERRADREHGLTALGGSTESATIRSEIERLEQRLSDLQARHTVSRSRQHEADDELRTLEQNQTRQDAELQSAEVTHTRLSHHLTRDTATRDALLVRLPDVWKPVSDTASLAEEWKSLNDANIAQQFQALEEDATLRREWEEQRMKVHHDRDGIPDVARVSVDEAKRNQRSAGDAFQKADAAHHASVTRRDDLSRSYTHRVKLTAAIVAAEADARIHAKLDHLLGKDKLQRELIREAEAAIVQLAQQTLSHLSGGDLSIALTEADGDEKALDLLVRRGEDPEPIGVKYLSGSQKFRVAVAVALAIGRYATGQARPLECVIIDEGFGSLDRDGLRAAADELNRLKDHLRRIIVVSHQDEFTEQFPVVIRLNKGEAGTTAEAVCQRR